jgi:integrase
MIVDRYRPRTSEHERRKTSKIEQVNVVTWRTELGPIGRDTHQLGYYFRIMRQVIASQLDERFRPVHRREWNLAAIGLPRVNPKNRRRPTMTPKEMTTLLAKAEGQYLMIYFLSLITGMRISETVAIEIDKHIEPDCSIIYVRQQREKDVNALKPHLKTEADCVT